MRTVRVIGPTWSSVKDSGKTPRREDEAIGRLQPDQPAMRGRVADRPAGVRPERCRQHPRRDGGAGGPRRSRPDDAQGFQGLRAGGKGRSKAGPPDGEFMRRQLGWKHRPGRPQPRHHGGVRLGDAVELQLRMAGRGMPCEVDDVLEADGDAVQRRARAAGRDLRLGGGAPAAMASSATRRITAFSRGSSAAMRSRQSARSSTGERRRAGDQRRGLGQRQQVRRAHRVDALARCVRFLGGAVRGQRLGRRIAGAGEAGAQPGGGGDRLLHVGAVVGPGALQAGGEDGIGGGLGHRAGLRPGLTPMLAEKRRR